MSRDETSEVVSIDASRQIVSGRNRAERARIVGEAGGVVDAGGLCRFAAEAQHSLDRIVEPPRRTQEHRGIMPGERRQLAAVRRLVEREHDKAKARVVPIIVEQMSQIARELSGNWNVSAPVRPVALVKQI